MATARLLRTPKPVARAVRSSSTCSSLETVRCMSNAGGFCRDQRICGEIDQKKSTVAMKASTVASESVITAEPGLGGAISLPYLVAKVTNAVIKVLKTAVKRNQSWHLQIQMFIERVIVDCRFFTLFAVVGSLIGSVLCFVEGCFLILESYVQYFHMLSQRSDQAHIIHLLIEAIDMFLMGTAMLIFGVGMYVMFVGSKNLKGKGSGLLSSNFFGLFYLKRLPTWVEMESVSQAKSKIGHAVMMILQVGVLDKFKSIPLVNSLDLACFAGSVLLSSACIFILSKLSAANTVEDR